MKFLSGSRALGRMQAPTLSQPQAPFLAFLGGCELKAQRAEQLQPVLGPGREMFAGLENPGYPG